MKLNAYFKQQLKLVLKECLDSYLEDDFDKQVHSIGLIVEGEHFSLEDDLYTVPSCCAIYDLTSDNLIRYNDDQWFIGSILASTLFYDEVVNILYTAPRDKYYTKYLDRLAKLGFKKINTIKSADGKRDLEMWMFSVSVDEMKQAVEKLGYKW